MEIKLYCPYCNRPLSESDWDVSWQQYQCEACDNPVEYDDTLEQWQLDENKRQNKRQHDDDED